MTSVPAGTDRPTLEQLLEAGDVEYALLFPEPLPLNVVELIRDAFTQGVAMGKRLAAFPVSVTADQEANE